MPGQFIVPQFIESEDKIIGPITVRQFLICLAGAGVLFVEYKVLETAYFIFAALITAAVFGAFGFLKINGQPFHIFFLNFMQTQVRPPLRVWNKNAVVQMGQEKIIGLPTVEEATKKPRPSSTRLRELALTVNTGGVYKPEDQP
ncbi:MAG: PrgI family protein [Patescibacteria group bacterium]|nr:PrgI family protein [Patescibacteria group bacterium]